MITRAPDYVAHMQQITPQKGAMLRKQMYAIQAPDAAKVTQAPKNSMRGDSREIELTLEFDEYFGQTTEFV